MDTWFCEMDRNVPDLWTPIKGRRTQVADTNCDVKSQIAGISIHDVSGRSGSTRFRSIPHLSSDESANRMVQMVEYIVHISVDVNGSDCRYGLIAGICVLISLKRGIKTIIVCQTPRRMSAHRTAALPLRLS